jgi:transcriptional regulator with XRE-family HTH domain
MSTHADSGLVPEFTVADRLRKAREYAGLEQNELAERIGLGRTTISNYERGTTPPKRPLLLSWAMATGVSLDWLRGFDVPGATGGQRLTTDSNGDIRGYLRVIHPAMPDSDSLCDSLLEVA